jgi:hypothetical protein
VKRIVIAGVVGGLIVFLWSAFAHMVLPLGEVGFDALPNDEPVIEALKGSVSEPGLYFFPGIADHRNATEEELEAWEARLKAGPWGLVVYHPAGGEPMSFGQLGTELATCVLAALVAAWVLASAVGGYGKRAILVALLALFCWFGVSLSFWTWYGFPTDYTIASGVTEVVGWLLAGLAMAKIVPPPR